MKLPPICRGVAAVAIAIAAVLPAAACNLPAQSGLQCDVRKVPPTVLPWAGGDPDSPPVPVEDQAIVATAIATCDVVPPYHQMHVTLEQQLPGGLWAPVANPLGNTYTECLDLPGPGQPVRCEHKVACEDGRYRTEVTVVYEDSSGRDTFYPPEQAVADIVCPS